MKISKEQRGTEQFDVKSTCLAELGLNSQSLAPPHIPDCSNTFSRDPQGGEVGVYDTCLISGIWLFKYIRTLPLKCEQPKYFKRAAATLTITSASTTTTIIQTSSLPLPLSPPTTTLTKHLEQYHNQKHHNKERENKYMIPSGFALLFCFGFLKPIISFLLLSLYQQSLIISSLKI